MLNNTTAAVDILNHSGKSKNIKYIYNVSIFLSVNNWVLVSRNTGQWTLFSVLSDRTSGVHICYWILNSSFTDTGMQIKKAVLSLFILAVNDSLKYELTYF